MFPRKRTTWLLTLVFGALFTAAAWFMAWRIRDFNVGQHFRNYHSEPILSRDVRVPGFPPAKFEDSTDPATGEFAIKLTYGEPAELRYIAVKKPVAINLPNLGIYEEWLRVLAVNEVVRDPASGIQSPRPDSERLIVAVRRTPEGLNAGSWGSVKRTEWLFDFHELNRDGTITLATRRWPMPVQRERRFQERASEAAADPGLKALAAIPPLGERGIEYLAALHVIPKLNVPKYKFTDTALSPRTLGWTLPVGMLSGLGFCFAFFFAVAPPFRASTTL